ncbi:hydrocephalus-inducing protein homolog [Hyperolius riggenbachi]|uniref:hydrocephalus-inducing protein homolog n=1 Tax=Hyperolius riggenbachi TaxID=752182 RepID=UPI0035A32529
MPSSKTQGPLSSLQDLPGRFHSKVLAPRNPRLSRQEEAATTLTPSAFLREMALSTEQRLANTREMRLPKIVQLLDMSETTHQKFSTVDLDQALFQPFPSKIIFQNYLACETYEVPLVLRNNDKVPRLVKVVQENSPYFSIISPNDVCNKVAPGMPSTFRIQFTPEENKDYFHEVVCITEREKFVVPIQAIGARAVLDFPDELSFQVCPVKYSSQKTLLVRNIGNRQACFQLLTQRPFSVEPLSGTLEIAESMQVTLEFHPLEVGDHTGNLLICYDTGEEIHVSLYGAATDINVRLDKNSLTIEKTFLSLTSQRTVTISNRSDIIAHFQWKELATLLEEEAQRQRFCSDLITEEEEETEHFLEECSADPTVRERLSLLSRTFHNRRKLAETDAMLFSDNIFYIEPLEGDVWPNSSVQVTVLFRPKAAQLYQRTVYCDVTGRESRLPLRIRGEGLGPKLRFSFDQLDIGRVFVGSSHSYEVILANEGAIDGIFSFTSPTSAVASCFTFSPSEGIILPDGHQAIQITLCCNILGDFTEEFRFAVDGAPEDMTLTVRGCVIGPTFHFSVPALNFGDVSFGFPCTLTCSLNNTSLVPMSFSLRVPGDGREEPSTTSHSFVLEDKTSSWKIQHKGGSRAQEFSIIPSRGTIRSQGLLDIEVTFCCNQVRRYELALVVDVDGIGEEVLALPITAKCVVPSLYVENPIVKFSRCFLQYPYEKTVTITNPSHLAGCYAVLPQEADSSSSILFESPHPRGVVQPLSSVEVPIVIKAQLTGEQNTKAGIAVFGHTEAPLEVFLLCTGEGPVIHVHPSELDFGSIPVLTDIYRTLRLSNQSLIPAPFQASMVRKRSLWRVEPSSGEVPAEGEVHLMIVAHLDDTVAFKDTIELVITNSNTYLIPVRATGIGTTIVTDRPFAPVLNLGAHFSAGPCRYHFTMTNQGRRTHQLYWMTEGFPQFRKRQPPPGHKSSSPPNESPAPVFRLHPSRMELHPGQSVDVVLEGSSDIPKMVKEHLVGQAIIGKQTGKEKIMMVDVICEFIAPLLDLSRKMLHFYVEKRPDEELKENYEMVKLKNISLLPLSIFVSVKHPFSVCHADTLQTADLQSPLQLQTGEEQELAIRFDPTYITDLQSRVLDEVLSIQYAEHPHTDSIALQAEVHFPNLHFPTTHIHFGCVLNDTESTQELEVANCSPLPVQYRWTFVTDNWESHIRFDGRAHKIGGLGKVNNVSLRTQVEAADEAGEDHRQNVSDIPEEPKPENSSSSQDHPLESMPRAKNLSSEAADDDTEDSALTGVEEVFDILPQFGTLLPGESQTVSFTFYGHSDISAEARALCEVYGGPVYEISLHGEASLVSYTLTARDIDCGVQMFDQILEVDIVLKNTGNVSFPYTALTQSRETLSTLPGEPFIEPMSGTIPAGEEQVLKISYFPGAPESFQRVIQLQVAHLEPENITLQGVGVFPRISLDLPRNVNGNDKFEPLLRIAEKIQDSEERSDLAECDASVDTLVLMELERLLIKKHASEQLESGLMTFGTQKDRRRLLKADLPEYLLDFGFVILGEVRSHIIKVTNTGHFPVSFQADRRGLPGTGFSIELDRVRNLPCCQTETFQVKFDPQSAGVNLGPADVIVPIKVCGGPRILIRLQASVTMPSLCVSEEWLEFSAVQCGQCQIRSIQLHNQLPVPCEWTAISQEAESKVDKHIPMHLRKKLRQEVKPKAAIFEVMPAHDVLLPGQKKNIEIKFQPQEEKLYRQRLVLQVAQSSQRVMLAVQGQGLEPRLEFTPSMLVLGPVLPLSPGDDVEVVVKNPCTFPIEFYSLEMDKQYLEEEKILGMLTGYDSQNTLLFPPRLPGEKMPPEILDFYEEKRRHAEDQDEGHVRLQIDTGAVEETEDGQLSDGGDKQDPPLTHRIPSATSYGESHSSRVEAKAEDAEADSVKRPTSGDKASASDVTRKAVGELELNPVSQALARYMGIDTSHEGQAARNRRGIAIIVHGAPLTGKSSTALALARHYNAACLSIDSVVLEAISDGNSSAGLKARTLCAKAALDQSLREAEEAGAQAAEAPSGQTGLSMEAVAKHTAEGGQGAEGKAAAHSVISRSNRGSQPMGKGKAESHQMSGAKHHTSDPSQSGSLPLPAPLQRRLSVSASVAGEQGLVSCVLPDDLLVEILSDRLQLNDCFRGVVFDGLENLFARNLRSTLHIVLKSLNNRQHIYFINLQQDYATMKAREKAQREHEEWKQQRALAEDKALMEEMDEEEYERLPAEERASIDALRLQALRERKKREREERLAREEQERKLQEELLKQKEQEELKKKPKRGKSRDSVKEDKDGKKSQVGNKQVPSLLAVKSEQRMDSAVERKVSMNRSDSAVNEPEDRKKKSKEFPHHHMMTPEDPEKDLLSEDEKQLIQRFKNYESSQKDVACVLAAWDRVQGILLQSATAEDGQHEGEELAPERQAPSGKKSRKDREREKQEKHEREKAEKERQEKERMDKLKTIEDEAGLQQDKQEIREEILKAIKTEVGIPQYDLQVSGDHEPSEQKILKSGTLPSVEEVLEGLGLGSSGPPIPPPYIFTVVPFPEQRTPPTDQETLAHFTFIAASPDDPNVIVEEKKEPEPEQDPVLAIPLVKEEQLTPTKSRSRKEKGGETGRESQKDKRRSSSLRKSQHTHDSRSPPPPGARTPVSDTDRGSLTGEVQQEKILRLGIFRWVVPAGGQVLLRIHFQSNSVGNFDQTLNFELVGTRRKYHLYCRGICAFPSISQEPKMVFPSRKKEARSDEIIQKKFILISSTFDFGPLLCGKSREKYKAGQYPENMEKLTIFNESPMESEITFCFQHDVKATTFILDPPTMTLKPNEKQELSIWAYPTSPGLFEDNIVCCIKDNPEPAIFHLCCRGVRPELELDRKQVHFEKILLHRKDTKTVFLRNSTFLPAAWRVTGLENLGDDFSVSQDQGIVAPRSEYGLQLHFKSAKPINMKKFIRLEVSDVENILGIVQLENIHVFAESYDVALDITFPKGTDGGLDFGVVKVTDEAKHILSLKNKGKYEIGFSFSLEAPNPTMPDLESIFSILPQKGTLSPSDRATQVQIIFQAKKEVQIADKPILKCQVIEPNLSEGGETIASIPIRVSACSAFSKYRLTPSSDINFGAMVLGIRKLGTFTLENCGLLEFRYNISKMIREVMIQPAKRGPPYGAKRSRSREGSGSSRSVAMSKSKRADSQLRETTVAGQARLVLGMFTVSPGFGNIPPGGQQVISVECLADQLGKSEEFLAVDVSDRNPDDHPSGIPFRLVTEACVPGFIADDIASIFEEHRIIRDARVLQCLPPLPSGGIYLKDENRFIFWNVIVGQTSCARFKIINPGKVPCDVALSVRPMSSKSTARINDIFDIQPSRMMIPSHSHSFVSVSFTPQSMQMFQCVFDAAVDGMPSALSKSRNLTIDICGEGNLPRVSILRPVLRNKHGNPVLLFQRLLIGQSQQLPLVLKNEGSIPAQLNIDLPECGQVFSLKPKANTPCIYHAWTAAEETGRRPHTASLILRPGDTAEFDVVFSPSEAQRCECGLQLSVMDNQYEKSSVQLVGEGYMEDLTLDNIYSPDGVPTPEGQLDDDVVEASRTEHIVFGDCHIGQQYQVTFTMTNRSPSDAMRFEWPLEGALAFSPQVGHIHAGCAKDVTVTLKSDVAVTMNKAPVKCKVWRISFPRPLDQVPDWDDRMRTVKWVDAGGKGAQRPTKKKVIETDPEPAHTPLDDGSREVELLVSAVVDYAQYQASCDDIHFRDTLLYQTRVYKFHIQNTGSVQLQYSWSVQMEGESRATAQEPLGSARSSSSHSRPSSALESVSSLLSVGVEASPFSVHPSSGSIKPRQRQEFSIKFSPVKVVEFEARLTCSIPNLSPGQLEPRFLLRGRSLLPYCHFQLEDSDYISSGRRNPELGGPHGAPSGTTLDPNTRVVEFTSVGVKARNGRTFGIMNPTNSPYSFLWTCEDPPDIQHSPVFRCLNDRGVIQPEKKVEITFEFIPQVLDITESFWSFTIPEQNISIPFLLVGKALEPSVSLDRSHLNFRSLLIGQEVQESIYLINNEKKSLSFTIRESSCFSEGHSQSLSVTPMEGSAPPLARIPIAVQFQPSQVGEVNFNLICDIKTKTEPLYLNVKADSHATEACIQSQDSAGTVSILSTQQPNYMDLGQVDVNDSSALQFHIINNGRFDFHFSSMLSVPRGLQEYLSLMPASGCVGPGKQTHLSLTFYPTKRCLIRDSQLTIRIENGPEVTCHIGGSAVRPGVHFSFTEHNFGQCFIYHEGMRPVRKSLLVVNKDDRDVSIDCLYSNTAHMVLEFSSDVLPPGGKMEIPIIFYPRAAMLYQETVVFQMNGHTQQNVQLQGQGIEMKVEVADPKYKVTHFGAVGIGQTVKRSIPIVNRSAASVTCTLSLNPGVPALQDPKVLSLLPGSEVTIPAHGGLCKLELSFTPRSRMAPFTEEVVMECGGAVRSLLVVRGSSQGLELSLDQDYITFGAVVLQSRATRRVVLSNSGELGARFQWDIKKFQPDFSISPVSGYLTAGTEVTFDVTFHPHEISSDLHYENLPCVIEGGRTLNLTLSGSCVSLPSSKEVVNFQCQVRNKQTQSIFLSNKTNQSWNLQPIIDGEHWRGSESISVEAHQQNKAYEITYQPLVMSSEGKKHQGSIFFPLPDGTGLMYVLQGIAEPPKSSGTIVREVPCKTSYTELLTVSNWLRKAQRFRVIIEVLKPERLDGATSVKGLDYLEVPGSAKRDYKLNFHSHKEGTFSTKVTFRNEATQEYLFYYVTFKSTPPGVIRTIELVTPVRQSTAATITVDNPLSVPVTFSTDCKVPEINLPPHITVPAQSEGTLMFEYQPLKSGESTGRLALQSSDLGLFLYDLLLKATPAVSEKPLYFRTTLGSSQTLTAKFTNYTRQKTEYSCKVDNTDFHVDKVVMAAPGSQGGSEVSLEVAYEPVQLGESRATLLISSPLGGDYTIPLFGSALAPKPQGPIQIRAGSSISIPFKNVFSQPTSFSFQTDPPAFTVKQCEAVRPKKTHHISVSYESPPGASKAPVTGRLVVSCPRATGIAQGIYWVYYLKGVASEK